MLCGYVDNSKKYRNINQLYSRKNVDRMWITFKNKNLLFRITYKFALTNFLYLSIT